MRKGFTLVELSIVLVIIGLLAAGILVARSMISVVRIQSQIRQVQQFDISITNFKLKYNQLPGDCSICQITGASQGNNNGKLEGRDDSSPPGIDIAPYARVWIEPYFFFIELSQMGDLKDRYIYTLSSVSFGVGKQFPEASIGRGGVITIGNNFGDIYYTFMTVNTTGQTDYPTIMPRGNFSPEEALSIDTKMDDANPATGDVAATTNVAATAADTIPLLLDTVDGNCTTAAGSKYNTSRPQKDLCRLVIKSHFQ